MPLSDWLMRFWSVRVLLIAFLLQLLFLDSLSAKVHFPNILILNSYHNGYAGTDDIIQGFRRSITEKFPEAKFQVEYLDSKNYSGPAYGEALFQLLTYKYKNHHLDLVFASDDYAYNLVEKNHASLFPEIPVVFCGTNSFDIGRLEGKNQFIGVDERPSFKETVGLIFKILPATKKVIVINDGSITGQLNGKAFRTETSDFEKQADFIYWVEQPLGGLVEKIRNLPANTAIVFLATYVKDSSGAVYDSSDALEILSAASPVALFGGWEFLLNHGIVGGKLINLSEHGALAGQIASKMLAGEKSDLDSKLFPSPNVFMFDDIELKRFAILDSKLPKGSIIINRPPSFYQQYKTTFFATLASILGFLVIASFIKIYTSKNRLNKAYHKQLMVEKALQKEMTFSTSLINTAQLIILVMDVKGRIQMMNPYMETITGYKEAEVKGKDWFDTFLLPADHTELRAMFKKAISNIDVSGEANPIVTKDGQVLMIEWHSKTLKDDSGTVIGLLSFGIDIAERKTAEEALKYQQNLLEKAQVLGQMGSWEYDPVEDTFLGTKVSNQIYGIPNGFKPTYKMFLKSIHRDDRKYFKEIWDTALRTGVLYVEHRIVINGTTKWVREKAEFEFDENGKNVRGIGFTQDITERKQAEQRNKAYQQQLITILNSIDANVYVADMETYEILFMNKNMIKDFSQDLTGQICWKAFRGESNPCENCTNSLLVDDDGQSAGVHIWSSQNPLNGKFYINHDRVIQWDDGRMVRLQIATDISDIKAMEQQLNLKHKMEAVGYMAGGMAHNFNNNLSIILGNVELSQMKTPKDSDIIPLLENAKIAVRRSRDLVLKIITYSRKGIQNKTSIHLSDVINETITLLQSTLPTTVNLQQEIKHESLQRVIHADPSQIQEILINLCNNAVHAMNEQGELKILLDTVELTAKDIPAQYEAAPGAYAKLSVQDTGCGMPAEMLDKIFDPFYTTKEEYEGAGMGLATVQGIVAQHDGVIKVNSVPDQGTVFNLYFPIGDHAVIKPEPTNGKMPKGTEKILFVDDDEMLANLGEKLFSEMGYQVSIMTESAEALKLFTANPDHFALVITDQTMPQLSGKELIQKLKKLRPDLRTILCTGFSSQIDENQARQQGIDAFCMKPLDLPELLQTVRRVLDEKQR